MLDSLPTQPSLLGDEGETDLFAGYTLKKN